MIPHDVFPLFPRPLYKTKVDIGLREKEINFILNQEMKNNHSNFMSVNQSLLDDPILEGLHTAITVHLQQFLTEVMGARDCKAYITQSWSLINMPGQGMHEHSHSNSIISGSYYFNDLPEPGSDMVFNRYVGNQIPIKLNLDENKQNQYNTMDIAVRMEKHDLLMFPSDISHYVDNNMSDKPRHSIAFNAFVKGQLGEYDRSNLLMIK